VSLFPLAIGVPVKAKKKAFFRACLIAAARSPYWVLCPSSMKAIMSFLVRRFSSWVSNVLSCSMNCVISSGRNLWISVRNAPLLLRFSVSVRCFADSIFCSGGSEVSRASYSVLSCSSSSILSTMKNMVGFGGVLFSHSLLAANIMVKVLPEPSQCHIKPWVRGSSPLRFFVTLFTIWFVAWYCIHLAIILVSSPRCSRMNTKCFIRSSSVGFSSIWRIASTSSGIPSTRHFSWGVSFP